MPSTHRGSGRLAATMMFAAALAFTCQEQSYAADRAERDLAAHLTGESERRWVKSRWESVLAVEVEKCVEGEIWIFSEGGNGTRITCDAGLAREEDFEWSIVGSEGDLSIARVNGREYVVELRQKKSELEGEPPIFVTILRGLRADQAEPVEEIRLEFWER